MIKVVRHFYVCNPRDGDIDAKQETIAWEPDHKMAEDRVNTYKRTHPNWELDGSNFEYQDIGNTQ